MPFQESFSPPTEEKKKNQSASRHEDHVFIGEPPWKEDEGQRITIESLESIKEGAERTGKEKELYQEAKRREREGLAGALQRYEAELGRLSAITKEVGRYIAHEEKELARLIQALESRTNQQIQNESTWWRKALAGAVGAKESLAREVDDLRKQIEEKLRSILVARGDLSDMAEQQSNLFHDQLQAQEQAAALDEEIDGFVVQVDEREIQAPSLENPFTHLGLEDLRAELIMRQKEQEMLKNEEILLQAERVKADLEMEELVVPTDSGSEELVHVTQRLANLNQLYDARASELEAMRVKKGQLSTSAWSRFGNRKEIAYLEGQIKDYERMIQDIDQACTQVCQSLEDVERQSPRFIAQRKRMEQEEEINRLAKKEAEIRLRLDMSAQEQVQIQQEMRLREPSLTRPSSLDEQRRRRANSRAQAKNSGAESGLSAAA